ncbi:MULTISPECIES: SDR family oxidoreductase [Butyricimonas]|uniref:SDR family oxidoreductase n=1 Tax=Butyricimonas TaxID=574697 RepID=UPI0007FB52D4|nr:MULTISPECIES: SDR family oxidoreductase [Butyricimonas]
MKKGWVVVTGANGGMGRAIALAVARAGMPVVMACRDTVKSLPVRDEIARVSGNRRVELLRLDLASFASIQAFAGEMARKNIAVLVNNAGVMPGEFSLTEDGLESAVGVNYVGTWLLTNSLLPFMGYDTESRIINTTSITTFMGHVGTHFLVPDPERFHRFRVYPDSKLAVLMFTTELARRLHGRTITVNAVDPGVVNTGMLTMGRWFDPLTDLLFRPFVKSPARGASSAIMLATTDRYAHVTGGLFRRGHPVKLPAETRDVAACRALWEETLHFVQEKLCRPWGETD